MVRLDWDAIDTTQVDWSVVNMPPPSFADPEFHEGVAPDRPEGIPVAVVAYTGQDPGRPWVWFLCGWPPKRPDREDAEPSGLAATKEEAMRCAEEAFPMLEEQLRAEEDALRAREADNATSALWRRSPN